jgi:predicted ArsR family transcriptional regulator
MPEASFFHTTRGRIVQGLKRHSRRSAADLAADLGLTVNAVRRHLARLQQDGLISQQRERRGRTKPSLVYCLTADGERLFPQRYDVLLNAILAELRREGGEERVSDVFQRIGERAARKHAPRFAGKDTAQRVGELAEILRRRGVVADHEAVAGGFVLREHNCPFKETVAAHPQLCSVVHRLMNEALPGGFEQKTSIARGDERCEFRIPAAQRTTDAAGLAGDAEAVHGLS